MWAHRSFTLNLSFKNKKLFLLGSRGTIPIYDLNPLSRFKGSFTARGSVSDQNFEKLFATGGQIDILLLKLRVISLSLIQCL